MNVFVGFILIKIKVTRAIDQFSIGSDLYSLYALIYGLYKIRCMHTMRLRPLRSLIEYHIAPLPFLSASIIWRPVLHPSGHSQLLELFLLDQGTHI
jgi:hypothetical protein